MPAIPRCVGRQEGDSVGDIVRLACLDTQDKAPTALQAAQLVDAAMAAAKPAARPKTAAKRSS